MFSLRRVVRPPSDFILTDRRSQRALLRQRRRQILADAATEIRQEAANLITLANLPGTDLYRVRDTAPGVTEIRRRVTQTAQEGQLVVKVVVREGSIGSQTDTSWYGYRPDGREVHASTTTSSRNHEGVGYYDGRRRVSGKPDSQQAREIMSVLREQERR